MWAFESWADFWHMGGYAGYVWSAVGITAAVFMAQLVYTIKQHKATKQRLRKALLERKTG